MYGTRNLVAALRSSVALFVVCFAPFAVYAQTDAPCAHEDSHQFDFWIGEWDVSANGKPAGVNRIQPILDGCVLQESWEGVSGGSGSSFNFYNPSISEWEQFWVWRNGTTLHLRGGYADGEMVLTGESLDRAGKTVLNRITWYDNDDDTVRQHWEVSRDDGKTKKNGNK